jgi:glucose-6-phosphate 1-dehydrogenase
MEAPITPEPDSFADERAKVLKATQTVEPGNVVYGQYDGYRRERSVAADSGVPTFVALPLTINTPRWYGVPIYLRAGKAMATNSTEAVVVFRESPPLPFSSKAVPPEANRLVFRIGPEDGVDLLVQTKLPGEGIVLATTPLTVDYENIFGRIPLAYERVLFDALEGNRSQFAREDAVEEAWRIVGRICDPSDRPPVYEIGSWGPAPAAEVIGDGRAWIDPTGRPRGG